MHGEILGLKTKRVKPGAHTAAQLVAWAGGFLERFCPESVVLLDAVDADRYRSGVDAQSLIEAVRRAAARRNLVPVESCREEIASAFRLGATTTVAIRLELASRYPFVAAHVSRGRMRSESDRYWEPAVLGAAAALAVATRHSPTPP